MNMLKATEKVNGLSKIDHYNATYMPKKEVEISKLIRIQIEEIKRKVGFRSPAALRFIGPGDQSANLIQRGVITNI